MFESIILGVIQGLTEFLPVSSSGHLVILSALLGKIEDGMFFDLMLHFGTLLATILVFREQIISLIKGLFTGDPESVKKCVLIIVACIPTGLIGILFKDPLEGLFDKPLLVSGTLLLTGTLLFITKFRSDGEKDFTIKTALLIGLVQGFAIIPGISRSGSTIAISMLLGIKRKEAGEFSFLISIPAILGAVLLKGKDVMSDPTLSAHIGLPEVLGVVASFVTGVIALKWLLSFVRTGKFFYFAPYVWIVGLAGLYIFS
ncbi:MAG: undecaprenyl-diphosphate phosphatase [Fibrobacterales bacterium]